MAGRYCGFTNQGVSVCVDVTPDGHGITNLVAEVVANCQPTAQFKLKVSSQGVIPLDSSLSFTDDYRSWFHREPGRYSPVAYDLGTIMLRGIDSGAITRPALLDFVRAYKGQGVAGHYAWTPTGELVQPQVWIYTVQETKQ